MRQIFKLLFSCLKLCFTFIMIILPFTDSFDIVLVVAVWYRNLVQNGVVQDNHIIMSILLFIVLGWMLCVVALLVLM